MKPHDIFNLAMRLIGLIFLYQGLSAVPMAFASFCPVFPHFNFRTLLPSFFLVGWPLAVGFYLIKGAPWLMRLAYPQQVQGAGAEPEA
jgi:hypothetical protein